MKLFLTIVLALSVLSTPAQTVRETELTPVKQQVEMNDPADFLKRLGQERLVGLYQGAMWTLVHDYRDFKHMEEVLNDVQKYLEALDAYAKGNPAPLTKLGGLKRFKDQLATLLLDNDQSIRAFAAVILGIAGDRAYAKQLANLLKPRKYNQRDLIHYDRGRAAMALGLVGAKEYVPTLLRLLRSKNDYDRSGAAFGLGFLTAKAHAAAVAKLLDDEEEKVREAAKESLEMMGAADLIKNRTPKMQ